MEHHMQDCGPLHYGKSTFGSSKTVCGACIVSLVAGNLVLTTSILYIISVINAS